MAKGKGFDPIADANELAEHNINPYYWVNRVTSFTFARWMAEKRLAVIVLPLYVLLWIAVIWRLTSVAALEHTTVWKLLFDFSSSSAPAMLAQLLLMAVYTIIVFIMVLQLIFGPQVKRTSSELHPKKEKKQPKRRKDWH